MNKNIQKINYKIREYEEEKLNMQNIIEKQEEKLTTYINKLNELEIDFKRKNKSLKENEAYAKELIKFVEEQKETIKQLKSQKKNNINKYANINNKYNLINNNQNNVLLPEIKQSGENIINENKKNDANIINNANDTQNMSDINNTPAKDLLENDEENQQKLKEFKNLMDNLVNGLNDLKNV